MKSDSPPILGRVKAFILVPDRHIETLEYASPPLAVELESQLLRDFFTANLRSLTFTGPIKGFIPVTVAAAGNCFIFGDYKSNKSNSLMVLANKKEKKSTRQAGNQFVSAIFRLYIETRNKKQKK